MLFIICSKIQGYMLSFMNEVDSCLLLPLCVSYEIQNQIFQHLGSFGRGYLLKLLICDRIEKSIQSPTVEVCHLDLSIILSSHAYFPVCIVNAIKSKMYNQGLSFLYDNRGQ